MVMFFFTFSTRLSVWKESVLPTGVYFLLPVIHIKTQVLAGSGGIICSLVDPCLFGDTLIEPTELDLWSEKNPTFSFYHWIPETRNLRVVHNYFQNLILFCMKLISRNVKLVVRFYEIYLMWHENYITVDICCVHCIKTNEFSCRICTS
jgi:hypothetical protein